MPVKVTNFGGLYPRAQPRALPDDGAQTANNVLATTREFRPLDSDLTVVNSTGINDPKTIFRLQRKDDGTLNTDFTSAATWKIYAGERSFAKGQVNDDLTDRTYYTFDDGSAPPRWMDATGEDRQLGVPAPTNAPTIAVNAVAQFSTTDRATALLAARQQVVDIIRGYATPTWRGATHPGTSTTGYADQVPSNGFSIEDDSKMVRGYRLSGQGGTITNTYATVTDGNQFTWVFDPALGAFQGPAAATPSWAGGAGTWHVNIAFPAYGQTFDMDVTSIGNDIAAIAMPGVTDGTKLFTTGQVTTIKALITDYADPAGDQLKPKLDALANSVQSLKVLLDSGQQGSLAAATQAFYSRTDVAAEITAAIANAAEAIFSTANGIATSSSPPENAGPGVGGY